MTNGKHVIACAGAVPLSVDAWLAHLKRRGQLMPLLREAVLDAMVAHHAAQEGLRVTDAELQRAADGFRRQHGLAAAADVHAWLARTGLSVAEFEQALEHDMLAARLKDHVTRDRIAGHFTAHRDRYARARLRRLVTGTEQLARELCTQITADGADFGELARTHSLDYATRATGGSLGVVLRAALPAGAADAMFATKSGKLVGPLAGPQGHALFLVEELLPPELDADTTAAIRNELFGLWLGEQLRDFRIDLSWLESV